MPGLLHNRLLAVNMLAHFCRAVKLNDADAGIAMTRAGVLQAKYPNGQRRFYAMRDDACSNCKPSAFNPAPRASMAANLLS